MPEVDRAGLHRDSSRAGSVGASWRRPPWVSVLLLQRTRSILHTRKRRAAAVAVAAGYGVVALLAGFMLQVGPTGASGTTARVLTNSYSPAWWNYPALVVVAPGGVLALPFLATVSMLLVAAGVGLGMVAGVFAASSFLRSWKARSTVGGAGSTLVGLTPAMVALLTVGACCSTGAAAAGGLGGIAQLGGTSYTQILNNPWALYVVQLAVLGIALVAQEELLVVFGGLREVFDPGAPTRSEGPTPRPNPEI